MKFPLLRAFTIFIRLSLNPPAFALCHTCHTKSERDTIKRIYVPTENPEDWKEFLADKNKHWKQTKSAYELAHNWENAAQSERGLPEQVVDLLDGHDATHDARLLLAFPEHKVAVEGRGFPSQTDLWALLRGPHGLISLAVEGKAGEPFGEIVQKWLGEPEGENR